MSRLSSNAIIVLIFGGLLLIALTVVYIIYKNKNKTEKTVWLYEMLDGTVIKSNDESFKGGHTRQLKRKRRKPIKPISK